MDEVSKDTRFAHIAKDPRFRQMKKKDRKVQIDKRFQGMFSDKKFKLKYSVDKRGRPVNRTTNEDLQRYYEMSSSSEDSDDDEKDKIVVSKKKNLTKKSLQKISQEQMLNAKAAKKERKTKEPPEKKSDESGNVLEVNKLNQKKSKSLGTVNSDRIFTKVKAEKNQKKITGNKVYNKSKSEKVQDSSEESGEESEEEEDITSDDIHTEVTHAVPNKSNQSFSRGDQNIPTSSEEDDSEESEDSEGSEPDLARGEGNISSSSDEEEEENEKSSGDNELDHKWGELDKDAPMVEDATRRIAICNMDWDRIKAQDLLVVLNSFKPAGGLIHSVKIYPSEFGLARLAEEDVKGPPELADSSPVEKESADTEGEAYHMEKLRKYQLNRLKYYYAVVTCDSAGTADAIYKECDGIEYESSGIHMDLRFIPDEMEFDHPPKSVAESIPETSTYKPSMFINTALQQSKVEVTWDETNPDRIALTTKQFKKEDLESMDVADYLASSSEGEEDPYGDFIQNPDFGTVEPPGGEEEDEEAVLSRYRSLVQDIKQKDKHKEEKDTEMEISWEPGLKETTEELIKKKQKEKEVETVWDQYLEKRKEKKKSKREQKKSQEKEKIAQKESADEGAFSDDDLPSDVDLNDPYFREELQKETKVQGNKSEGKKKKKKKSAETPEEEAARKKREAELALLLMDPEEDKKQHFNLKAIQEREKNEKRKKRKKKLKKQTEDAVQDSFQIDVKDPRFEDIYKNPLFNLDPSAPEYKATKASQALVKEKQKRREMGKLSIKRSQSDHDESSSAKQLKKDTSYKDNSLASLVKSVKMKTQSLQQKKKTKLK